MGMYTEIFVNVNFLEETPNDVINTLKAICQKDYKSPLLQDRPKRWSFLFNNSSYYTPATECSALTYEAV